MSRDMAWIDDLAPYEAQAALDALNAHKGPYTEAYELQRLKKALQVKATC
jgi:hypothetical protein